MRAPTVARVHSMTMQSEAIPDQVLRAHCRPVVAMSYTKETLFSMYQLWFRRNFHAYSDDYGVLWSWRNNDGFYEKLNCLAMERERISHMDTTLVEDVIYICIQFKSARLKVYRFCQETCVFIREIRTGDFTFCKMSCFGNWVAYPSPRVENGICIESMNDGVVILDDYKPRDVSGMCMFCKLYPSVDIRVLHLMLGYESGLFCLLAVNTETNATASIIESRLIKDSVISADLHVESGLVVIVGASEDCVVLRHIWNKDAFSSESKKLPSAGFNTVVIRPDGKLFVTGGWDAR